MHGGVCYAKRSVWVGITVCKHTESVNVEMKFLESFVVISSDPVDCIVWVKCTNSAECKTIRIAVSTVMDMLAELLKVRFLVLISKDLLNDFGFLSKWVLGG